MIMFDILQADHINWHSSYVQLQEEQLLKGKKKTQTKRKLVRKGLKGKDKELKSLRSAERWP